MNIDEGCCAASLWMNVHCPNDIVCSVCRVDGSSSVKTQVTEHQEEKKFCCF